jgi:hypothetical protein
MRLVLALLFVALTLVAALVTLEQRHPAPSSVTTRPAAALAFGPATRPLSTQPHTRVTVTAGHPVAIRITGHVH